MLATGKATASLRGNIGLVGQFLTWRNVHSTQQQQKQCKEEEEKAEKAALYKQVEEDVMSKRMPIYSIEQRLKDCNKAVSLRRKYIERELTNTKSPRQSQSQSLQDIPHKGYDYNKVYGVCCENVIGYLPVPLGVAGPLSIDGATYHVPLATTEGALVASVNRGCKAIMAGSGGRGVRASVQRNGMSRAPVVEMPSAEAAGRLCAWLRSREGFTELSSRFNATSGHISLESVTPFAAGRTVYIRFSARTGDAMGMNMLSIATEHAMRGLARRFPEMTTLSLSSNFCSDKKPAAINFMLGRGHSVCAETVVSGTALRKVLGTSGRALERLALRKCWLGSALAGAAPGGLNAHAANIVAAAFLATGQDLAQVVESSNCVTSVERIDDIDAREYRDDPKLKGGIVISCTMPSLEVGTVGGGTRLAPQASCLKLLGVAGPSEAANRPSGSNSATLAKVICSAVLAGELSLLAALTSKMLIYKHMITYLSFIFIFSWYSRVKSHQAEPSKVKPQALKLNVFSVS